MARIVKSNFLPNAPCNLLILLDKKRVCGCNSSLIIKGLIPSLESVNTVPL